MNYRITPFLLFIAFLLPLFAQGQTKRLYVQGQVRTSRDGKPLEGAMIRVRQPPASSLAGNEGRYILFTENRPGIVIEYSFTGHTPQRKTLTPELLRSCNGDTLTLNITLVAETYVLPTVDVKSGPDTVIGSYRYFIEDYLFIDSNRFLLLTFEKNLKAARIMLAEGQKILSAADVPAEATELYRDYMGFNNVLCKDSAFRIKILPGNKLLLMALPYRDYTARYFPCIDTVGPHILFSNYNRDYPQFSYYLYHPADTTAFRIRTIADWPLLNQYNWEFDFLQPKDRLYARKMELYLGVDKRIIAATMTGFTHSPQYTPLYAPLFFIRDTIFIFDHYANQLFRYTKYLALIDSLPISYHHPKNWREWDRALIRDEVTGEVYARFEKNGYYTLKRIDLHTGQITGTFRITKQFVKHIRIRNGQVYYLWHNYETPEKKMLWKEPLALQ
ncbi:MAG: hypothetical protein MUC87_15415 [Bacteroidia bacterium]|jgi:hypothetical protein|nr:hypothetical protein [Bacteroidia bacterium]